MTSPSVLVLKQKHNLYEAKMLPNKKVKLSCAVPLFHEMNNWSVEEKSALL